MKVVEVLLGTPEVEVDKLNQGSTSKSPTSLLIPGLLLIHQYVRFITEKSPKYDILQNNLIGTAGMDNYLYVYLKLQLSRNLYDIVIDRPEKVQ